MSQGLIAPNVDLQTTINNLPFQEVELNANDSIKNTYVLNNSNYVCAVSEEGVVQIWHTELALINVLKNDFKKKISKEEPVEEVE